MQIFVNLVERLDSPVLFCATLYSGAAGLAGSVTQLTYCNWTQQYTTKSSYHWQPRAMLLQTLHGLSRNSEDSICNPS